MFWHNDEVKGCQNLRRNEILSGQINTLKKVLIYLMGSIIELHVYTIKMNANEVKFE
jgi:hypothetical protein